MWPIQVVAPVLYSTEIVNFSVPQKFDESFVKSSELFKLFRVMEPENKINFYVSWINGGAITKSKMLSYFI